MTSLGAWKIGIADVTMDNSYPTGGELLTIADWGLESTVYTVLIDQANGYVAEYDYTLNALKVMVPVKMIHNGTPSAQTVFVTAADTDLESNFGATADFLMKEVEAATDLSTVMFRVTMIGE